MINVQDNPSDEITLGADIEIDRVLISEVPKAYWNSFDSGNEVIDEFFRKKAIYSRREKTHVYIDTKRNRIIAAASLCCSAVPLMSNNIYNENLPSVEITYFAVDKHYQHLPMDDFEDNQYLSDSILNDVILFVYGFIEEICGVTHIVAYSTPNAVRFIRETSLRKLIRNCF